MEGKCQHPAVVPAATEVKKNWDQHGVQKNVLESHPLDFREISFSNVEIYVSRYKTTDEIIYVDVRAFSIMT